MLLLREGLCGFLHGLESCRWKAFIPNPQEIFCKWLFVIELNRIKWLSLCLVTYDKKKKSWPLKKKKININLVWKRKFATPRDQETVEIEIWKAKRKINRIWVTVFTFSFSLPNARVYTHRSVSFFSLVDSGRLHWLIFLPRRDRWSLLHQTLKNLRTMEITCVRFCMQIKQIYILPPLLVST